MGLDYALEKTMAAVMSMAADPDSISDRVARAYSKSLIHIQPEEDLPRELRPLFADIRTALTSTAKMGSESGGTVYAPTMGAEQASELARKIVTLFYEVCAAWAASQR